MKPEIPGHEFKENDATKLIASYGVKPPPVMKQKLEEALRKEKEQFLVKERERSKKGREQD